MKIFYSISLFLFSTVILNAQNVGIGTTSPNASLQIKGNASSTVLLNVTDNASNSRMHIKTGGNVGIGTTNPLSKLQVNGLLNVGNSFTPAATSSDNILNLQVGGNPDGATNGISFFENDGGFGMKIGYDGTGSGPTNALLFYDDRDSMIVTLQNGGNLGLGTTPSTVHKLDARTASLGNNTKAVYGQVTGNVGISNYHRGVHGVVSGHTDGGWYTGVYGDAYRSTVTSAGRTYGVYGRAGNATDGWNYGVYGLLHGSNGGAAIYGAVEGYTTYTDMDVNGSWAGFFNGDVNLEGGLAVGGSKGAAGQVLRTDGTDLYWSNDGADNLGNHTATQDINIGSHSMLFNDTDYSGIYFGEQYNDAAAHSSDWGYIRQGTANGQLEIGSDATIAFYETDARTLRVNWDLNNGAYDFDGSMNLAAGTSVNEFSTDGTLGGNSNNALPTENAVKTYVDSKTKPTTFYTMHNAGEGVECTDPASGGYDIYYTSWYQNTYVFSTGGSTSSRWHIDVPCPEVPDGGTLTVKKIEFKLYSSTAATHYFRAGTQNFNWDSPTSSVLVGSPFINTSQSVTGYDTYVWTGTQVMNDETMLNLAWACTSTGTSHRFYGVRIQWEVTY